MLWKEPVFGNLDFQALPQKNHPSNPGRPSKRFPSPIHCRYKRCKPKEEDGGSMERNFTSEKSTSKIRGGQVDPQQELLLQKMNIKVCKFGSPTQLPIPTTNIMSMQTEFHQNRNQKSLIYKPTTHRGKSCTLMRCKTKLEMGNGRNLTLHPSPIWFQLPIML